MTQQPQAKYRHDYRAPEYLISDIDLTFDLDAAKTVVTAESKVSRHAAASDVPLRLDGEDLTLIALQVNGQPWSDYKEENNQLVIGGLPEHFTLTIVNEISPAANKMCIRDRPGAVYHHRQWESGISRQKASHILT